MYGDFTRLTHDPRKHYLRVLMQQGRVQLDADWNEQASILLRYLQTLAADLIGPFGGPGDGFLIAPQPGPGGSSIPRAFTLQPGHYYVDGILAENDAKLNYGSGSGHLPFPRPENDQGEEDEDANFLALVLDVFERHVSHLQDAGVREVALGGPDTATRSQVAWRVRAWKIEPNDDEQKDLRCFLAKIWEELVALRQPANRGQLRARAKGDVDPRTDPCVAAPEASFRRTENQLYRVEIHRGGMAWDKKDDTAEEAATFKWSRDNGSEEYRILRLEGTTAFLESLGRDDRTLLHAGDWLELVEDQSDPLTLLPLLQVESVDPRRDAVILKVPKKHEGAPTVSLPDLDEEAAQRRHALLRRWHQPEKLTKGAVLPSEGAVLLTEGDANDPEKGWLMLEDGVQIRFEPGGAGTLIGYRPGDFWLIPARTATGDVEWPRAENGPLALPPNGVEHHFAPLATIAFPDDAANLKITDCRNVFQPLGYPSIDLSTGKAAWRVTSAPSPVPTDQPPVPVQTLAPNWAILPGLTWVSAIRAPDATGPLGLYAYELHFCIGALRIPRLELSLLADDSVQVFLNNKLIGERAAPAFTAPPLKIVRIGREFLSPGDNVLQVKVTNNPADTPTGYALSGVVTTI
jgi:hypothetical protein